LAGTVISPRFDMFNAEREPGCLLMWFGSEVRITSLGNNDAERLNGFFTLGKLKGFIMTITRTGRGAL
jgi:hypothetical protein